MRSFLGIVIGLFGLIVCAIPVSMLLWASQQVRFGLSNSGTWTLEAIGTMGLICLGVSYWLLRGRWS